MKKLSKNCGLAKWSALTVALASIGCSLSGLVAAQPGHYVSEQKVNFGRSVQGLPLTAYVLGKGANETIVFGDFHGNERSVPGVVNSLRLYLKHHPEQWSDCTVILVPYANPDGWAAGTRTNAHHVDINRNFPTLTWKPLHRTDRYNTNRFNPGPFAGSEPETRAIIGLIKKYRPTKIVSIHQPLHMLAWTGLPGKELAAVMQKANGYRVSSSVGYKTPGAFGDYCGEHSIAIVTLELSEESASNAWAANRTVLLAAIQAHSGAVKFARLPRPLPVHTH
jgi:protein MpaA